MKNDQHETGQPVQGYINRLQPRFQPHASLTLEGVDGEEVSRLLGIPNDLEIPPEVRARMEKPLPCWTLDTHKRVASNRLADHVTCARDVLKGKEALFREIAATASRANFMFWGDPRFWITDNELSVLVRAELGVRIGFGVTVDPPGVYHVDDLTLIPPIKEHHPGVAALLGHLGYPATETEAATQLAAVQAAPNTLVLVAAIEHEVFGLITSHIFPSIHSATPIAWITTLVVSGDSQGMGVGTMLLEEAERWAAENGAERVSLTSGAHRADAHAFYQKKGYENTGFRFSKKL